MPATPSSEPSDAVPATMTAPPRPGTAGRTDLDLDTAWLATVTHRPPRPRMSPVWNALHGSSFYYRPIDAAVAHRILDVDSAMRLWAGVHLMVRTAAVAALLADGHTQWLDLECGYEPDRCTYQDLLRSRRPGLRLLSVDIDGAVIAALHEQPDHTQLRTAALTGDLADPHRVLQAVTAHQVLDLGRPVVIVLTAVLQHLNDAQAVELLAELRTCVVAGSRLILSHPGPVPATAAMDAALEHVVETTGPLHLRDSTHAAALLGSRWRPAPPGVAPVGAWPHLRAGRPADPTEVEQIAASGWAVLAEAS